MTSDLVKGADGSSIAIQTSKGLYNCGERVDGFVVLQNRSPRQIDRVVIRVTVQERVYWDEEITRTVEAVMHEHDRREIASRVAAEGGDDDARAAALRRYTNEWHSANRRTVYEHHEQDGFVAHVDDLIVVNAQPHVVAPGAYSYPFSYALRPDLPGCAQYHRERDAADPAWRAAGRRNKVHGEVSFRLKACVDVAGVFSRDLVCRYALTVNPAFDWAAMQPARGAKTANVVVCCCWNRGAVTLECAFNRAAFASGETAQVAATISERRPSGRLPARGMRAPTPPPTPQRTRRRRTSAR